LPVRNHRVGVDVRLPHHAQCLVVVEEPVAAGRSSLSVGDIKSLTPDARTKKAFPVLV
jgi:hypothetical protein